MKAVPPKIPRTSNGLFAGILLAATAVGLIVVVFFFNPATHPIYPVCQFHRLTGLNCPGCGMTRALHALLHANFATALRDNALFVLTLGAGFLRAAWYGWNRLNGQPNREFFPMKFLWPLLTVALVFTVLRNLPAFKFLDP